MLGRFSHPNNLRADGADLSSHRWDRCRDVNGKSPVIWSEAFCVFNNWLSYRALVSLMISSNLLTLNWIFLQRPQCAIRKTTNKRGFSSAGGFWAVLHLTSRMWSSGLKFPFILATRELCRTPGGWLPSQWNSQCNRLPLQTEHSR